MTKWQEKRDDPLTEEAEILDEYLNQYRHSMNRKKSLERRRLEIINEFELSPLSSPVMDGMPRSTSTGVGCAALSYRLDEINTKIAEQTSKTTKILLNIMDILDFLPEGSRERAIFEHKYIDRFGWEQICREVIISKSPAIRAWKKGLYTLLTFKKVKQILKEYQEDCGIIRKSEG